MSPSWRVDRDGFSAEQATVAESLSRSDFFRLARFETVPVAAFDPEIIEIMSAALRRTCEKLRLEQTDNSANRLVAHKIVELALSGVRDVVELSDLTFEAIKERVFWVRRKK
jgi:hypothetical protein